MNLRRRHSTALFPLAALAAFAAACSGAPRTTEDPSAPTAASSPTIKSSNGTSSTDAGARSSDVLAQRQWRRALSKTPTPKPGCFTSSLGSNHWNEVACGGPPSSPNLGRSRQEAIATRLAATHSGGAGGDTVGNTVDSAAAAASLINWAEGSFPSEVGGASETGSGGANDGANAYSLQMNTNRFSTPACDSSTSFACQGWEQFVYDAAKGEVYIELSLLNYAGSCPSGYPNSYTVGSDHVCFTNSDTMSVPKVAASDLAHVSMTAATGAGNVSFVTTIDGQAYNYPLPDYLGLASGWTGAEFNVVGQDDGGLATFNSATSLEVQVLLGTVSPTRAAPSCSPSQFNGWTGETNSLNLVGNCCPFGGNSPGIQFFESTNASATPPACPTLDLWSSTSTFVNDTVTGAAGSTVTGVAAVVGGLVDSSLDDGLAPNSCTVTGNGTVMNEPGPPVVTFDLPLASANQSWTQTVQCDTGASVTETIRAVSDPFLASPASVSLIPGGASASAQWGYTQPMAQLCEVPTYQLGALPLGVTGSLSIDGLLTLSAGSSAPLGTYTVDVSSNCSPSDGPYSGALTVHVVSCIPKACNASSCQGTIADGCGSTVVCPSTCASPDTCVAGTCTAPPPPPPPPPPPVTCNGVRKPTSTCSAPNAWRCCSAWSCSRLCSAPKAGLEKEGEEGEDGVPASP